MEKAGGGSRMRQDGEQGASVSQGGQATGAPGATAGTSAGSPEKSKPAPTAPKSRAKGPAAAPEIDYEKLATMVAGKLAPVFSNREVTNEGMAVGQMPDIVLEDGTLATGGAALEPVDKPLNKDYLSELAFMEEPMIVIVQETEDPNAENPVIVGVNGTFKPFFRGHPTVAKRKFVDGLIVKSTRVTTPEVLNGAGERTNVIRQHSAHKYGITIVQDKNPKGVEWLTRRMAEQI